MLNNNGEFEYTAEELDALFADDSQATPPAADKNVTASEQTSTESDTTDQSTESTEQTKIEQTKAFAKRLSEKTAKAVQTERENIAKQLGYESYDAMMKSRETSVLEKHGLDTEASEKAIDEIVQMRLNNDPRMQELEELRALKVQEYGKQQLAELTELTGGEITSFNQVPKEVIDVWKQCGSLKKAYLQVKGEDLLLKTRKAQTQTTTEHMQVPGSNSSALPDDRRTLTDKEKDLWRLFNPSMTDEEINKLTTKK